MTRSIITWLFLAVLTSSACRSEPEDAASALVAIDTRLTEAAADGMNGVLLIRRHGEVVFHRAYGYRDREQGEVLTLDHGFDIGSIVKPMTTVAILRLVESGALTLDSKLSQFYPEIGADKAAITLRQVIEHQAGFVDVFGSDYALIDRESLREQILSSELLFEPGTDERYSNSGYSLLAMIIEDVSGRSYESFVREEVLGPAGVDDIGYLEGGWVPRRLAVGYLDGERWGTPRDKAWMADGPSWHLRGNGGMLATTQSLCRWYEAVFNGEVLGAQALEDFFGLATAASSRAPGRVAGHAGGNRVFNALQVSYVGIDTHLTFFTSDSEQRAENLWREIRPAFYVVAGMADPG